MEKVEMEVAKNSTSVCSGAEFGIIGAIQYVFPFAAFQPTERVTSTKLSALNVTLPASLILSASFVLSTPIFE